MARTKKKLIKKSNLHKIMKKRGINQYRLAKLLKRPPSQISQWMNQNNPDAVGCAQIMALLNCSIWDLLHTYEDPNEVEIDADLETDLDKMLEGI